MSVLNNIFIILSLLRCSDVDIIYHYVARHLLCFVHTIPHLTRLIRVSIRNVFWMQKRNKTKPYNYVNTLKCS